MTSSHELHAHTMADVNNSTRLALLACLILSCHGILPGFLDGFDLSKLQGPVPDNPDVFRNVSELITSKGYPVEEHFVTTQDGYILNIQRIPHGKNKDRRRNKPVVILQHGLLATSACWVLNFPENSLGFILADNGFDVWLTNSRGNTYARKNNHLSPLQPEFWKWSFDAMGQYDLPSSVNYILNETKQEQLVYIGHSQGTLIAFAGLSTSQELASKIKLFIALAPIAQIGNISVSYLRDLAKLVTTLEDFGIPLIDAPFLPGNTIKKSLEKGSCNGPIQERLCYKIAEMFIGTDDQNMNFSRIPVFFHNFPAGTSLRNMVHFAQLVMSGKCQKFDYGAIRNLIIYGQVHPPEYPIETIQTPIALFSGTHDTLSDPRDVALLARRIKNRVTNAVLENWNHIDFIDGEDATSLLYPVLIELAKKYNQV